MNLIELFTLIANAIRGKKGTEDKINASDFPTEIENIKTGIQQFSSVEEMNESTGNKDGDLAVVYIDTLQPVERGNTYTEFYLPRTIVFDTEITAISYISFGTSLMSGANIQVTQKRIRFRDGWTFMSTVEYTSDDGLLYTRIDDLPDTITISELYANKYTSITVPSTMSDIVYDKCKTLVFQSGGVRDFKGLFKYDGNVWGLAKTQLNTISKYVYDTLFYGKNGIEKGTLATMTDNSLADTDAYAYWKIKQNYENMTPVVVEDIESGATTSPLNENIRFVYKKDDGTPLLDTSNVIDMSHLFKNCEKLEYVPTLDTSNATKMNYTFYECLSLKTLEMLDISKVTNMNSCFGNCTALSDYSLNNILAMCTNATSVSTKTLKYVGLTSAQATRCQSLSNYSAFINAGWTTGY